MGYQMGYTRGYGSATDSGGDGGGGGGGSGSGGGGYNWVGNIPWPLPPAKIHWQLFSRAPDLTRAAILDDVIKCEFVRRNRAVSTWVLNVPVDGPAAQIQPGWGLIVTRDGVLELSGPVNKIDRTSQADTDTLTLSGVDDTCVLADRLAMPQPATAPAGATNDYDVRTGLASTVLAGYVNANAGPGAVTARRVTGLTMATDPMVGATVTGRARFDVLLELCRSLALQAGICFQIVQVGNALQFLTWAPIDRTASAVFSRDLGNLGDYAWTAAAPTANAVLVAGGGDLHLRIIEERVDAASAALWNRRVEMFRDRRDTVVTTEMDASGDEELAKGAAVDSLALTPIQADWLRYGTHYNIGDSVTAVIGGVRTVQTVQEVTVSLTADGEVITPAIGSPDATPATTSGVVARLLAEQKAMRIRIRNLERT